MFTKTLTVFLSVALIHPLAAQQPPVALQAVVRTDFLPATGGAVDTSLTIQFNRDALQFRQREGFAEAVVNLTARITTMEGRRAGRIIEEVLEVRGPADQVTALQAGYLLYNTKVPLLPGRYGLTVLGRDVVGNRTVSANSELNVPTFQADTLSSSSLILADSLERIPVRSSGVGQFVIGGTRVRPRMDATFRRDGTLGIYLQVVHLRVDPITGRPEGTATYEIARAGSSERVLEFTEFVGGDGERWIIEKKLSLDTLAPGDYTLRVRVTDRARGETIAPTAAFRVM